MHFDTKQFLFRERNTVTGIPAAVDVASCFFFFFRYKLTVKFDDK